MRQLDPKIAEERKQKVLRWVVHNYIKTSRPIASAIIAEEAGLDLSSATIRSILKDLEDEGYLHQPHTSAGRVPTDRGYRYYVDFLQDVQRLASDEKSRIEREYGERVAELDSLLSQTSRLLSHVTRKTGLVLSPKLERQTLRRLELIPLGGPQVLAVVVTQTGQVRHWPIRLSFTPSSDRIHMLNRFLNENSQGKSISEVRRTLTAQIEHLERELKDLRGLAEHLFDELDQVQSPEGLYLDGTVSLMEEAQELGDLGEMQSLMRVIEERQALARVLEEDFRRSLERGEEGAKPVVRIGEENALPELKRFSLVTTTYRMGDQVVGVLGILGPRRMEYSRIISAVEYISRMVSRALESWEKAGLKSDEQPERARAKRERKRP